MAKKVFAITFVLLFALSIFGCNKPVMVDLTYSPSETETVEMIFTDGEASVYVVGGLVMATFDGETFSLEQALTDGEIDIGDIRYSMLTEYENSEVDAKIFPDATAEYYFDNFTLVAIGTSGAPKNIWIIPKDKGYMDIFDYFDDINK